MLAAIRSGRKALPTIHHPYLQEDGTIKMPDPATGEQTPAAGLPESNGQPATPPEGTGTTAPPAAPEAPAAAAAPSAEPAAQAASTSAPPVEPNAQNTEMVQPTAGYQLSQQNLHTDLMRLFDSDPVFAHAISTVGGRRNAEKVRRLEAELQQKNILLERYEREQRNAEIRALTPEAVAERLKDPKFAEEYSASLNDEDDTDERLAAVRELNFYQSQKDALYQEAVGILGDNRLAEYENSFKGCPRCDRGRQGSAGHSFWDHNDNGGFLTDDFGDGTIARQAAFNRFVLAFRRDMETQRATAAAALAAQRGQPDGTPAPPAQPRSMFSAPEGQTVETAAQGAAAQQPPAAPIGTANAALQTLTPDSSRTALSPQGNGRFKLTQAEYRAMTPQQKMEFFKEPGSYERMLLAGEIEPPEGYDPRVLQPSAVTTTRR